MTQSLYPGLSKLSVSPQPPYDTYTNSLDYLLTTWTTPPYSTAWRNWKEEIDAKVVIKLEISTWCRFPYFLKVPKCEIFDHFFYINKSYMGRWLEDWRKKNFFRRPRQIFAILFFFTQAEPALKFAHAGWACAKKMSTQAEPALKKCLRRLSLR